MSEKIQLMIISWIFHCMLTNVNIELKVSSLNVNALNMFVLKKWRSVDKTCWVSSASFFCYLETVFYFILSIDVLST